MKVYLKNGRSINSRPLRVEGMVLQGSRLKDVLIARRNKGAGRNLQNERLKELNKPISIIWKMMSEEFKGECRRYAEMYKKHSRKRGRRYMNGYKVYLKIVHFYIKKSGLESNIMKLVRGFYRYYNNCTIEEMMEAGSLQKFKRGF